MVQPGRGVSVNADPTQERSEVRSQQPMTATYTELVQQLLPRECGAPCDVVAWLPKQHIETENRRPAFGVSPRR